MCEVSDVFYDVSGPSNVAGFCGDVPGNPDKTLSRFDNMLQGVFFFLLCSFVAAVAQSCRAVGQEASNGGSVEVDEPLLGEAGSPLPSTGSYL